MCTEVSGKDSGAAHLLKISGKSVGLLNQSSPGGQAGVVTMHQHRAQPAKILFQGAGPDYWVSLEFPKSQNSS